MKTAVTISRGTRPCATFCSFSRLSSSSLSSAHFSHNRKLGEKGEANLYEECNGNDELNVTSSRCLGHARLVPHHEDDDARIEQQTDARHRQPVVRVGCGGVDRVEGRMEHGRAEVMSNCGIAEEQQPAVEGDLVEQI